MLKQKVEQISSSKAIFKAFMRKHDSTGGVLVHLLKKMIRVMILLPWELWDILNKYCSKSNITSS